MRYGNIKHKIHNDKRIYGTVKWAETKPSPENCKNCSSKCTYDCAQLQYAYTIQHTTVLIISPLTSRQPNITEMLSIGETERCSYRTHLYL